MRRSFASTTLYFRRTAGWKLHSILLACLFATAISGEAATGKVFKVLPQLLDLQGRHTLNPSLYERDAYQARLRQHSAQCSGVRFDVEWKASGATNGPLTLRVEALGVVREGKPQHAVLEQKVVYKGWFSQWNTLPLTGEEYKRMGEVVAWRATLWQGDQMLGEQKSFLW